MGNPTRLGALLAVFLFASDSMAQSPEARINAPGGNPANLARPFVHHAGEEGRVLFRTRTILIQVPVVVTERNGTHVHGLPKDQFEVFENGKQQNIVTFEEVVATNTPILLAAPPPGVFSNLPISADQPRSVTVVAIDLVNTPFLSQANARQQLIKYLGDNLDSSQATALVLFDERGVRVLQGLTTDAGSLVKLIKELNGQLPALHGVSPDSREDISGSSLLQPSGPTITSNSLRAFIDGGSNYAVMEQQDAVLATMRDRR
jgi:VWFA-related protein